ncbi:MAG: hypothetical protein U1E48_03325 [Paracoccaceae bacterium]
MLRGVGMVVPMVMLRRLVLMFVVMSFAQMQPDAEGHQHRRRQQLQRDRIAEHRHRHAAPMKGAVEKPRCAPILR